MTAYGSEEMPVDAMRQGADDYIAKGRLQSLMNSKCECARRAFAEAGTENRELRSQVDTKFGLKT